MNELALILVQTLHTHMKYLVFLLCQTFPADVKYSVLIFFSKVVKYPLFLFCNTFPTDVKYPEFLLFQSKVSLASEGQWFIERCTLTSGVYSNFHTFISIFWCLQRLSHILVPTKAHILINLLGSKKVLFLSIF